MRTLPLANWMESERCSEVVACGPVFAAEPLFAAEGPALADAGCTESEDITSAGGVTASWFKLTASNRSGLSAELVGFRTIGIDTWFGGWRLTGESLLRG